MFDPNTLLLFGVAVVMFCCGLAVEGPTEPRRLTLPQPAETLSQLAAANADVARVQAEVAQKQQAVDRLRGELAAAESALRTSQAAGDAKAHAQELARTAHFNCCNETWPPVTPRPA